MQQNDNKTKPQEMKQVDKARTQGQRTRYKKNYTSRQNDTPQPQITGVKTGDNNKSTLSKSKASGFAQGKSTQTRRTTAKKINSDALVKKGHGGQSTPKSAEKLKIIPLGGLNEIGKNMTLIEWQNDIIMIDCGLAFPDDEMLGVDIVIPDTTYLLKVSSKIRGLFLTHAHEDHIGAIPYVFRDLNVPIYATPLTAGMVKFKLEEYKMDKKVRIQNVSAGKTITVGPFKVEFIAVNHSIADAVAFAITTPAGVIVHTGDFKIDTTPIDGADMIDLTRFGELGKQGVLLLMSDSTNVERPGFAMSERKVGEAFDQIFKNCEKRILVASFASNIHRVQQIVDAAAKYGRKVAVSGRSMENMLQVATQLKYIKLPRGILVDIDKVDSYPKNKMVIITTGSQGEPMSALYRMAISGHKNIEICDGDLVIFSSSPIPGNEKTVSRVVNALFKKGAEVIYERLAEVHVSGHACREELKLMLALTKPKFFMPVHGEYRHLANHAMLAEQMGIAKENIIISDIGAVLEINSDSAKLNGTVTAGKVLVDGLGVGDVSSIVLRERKHLSQDGLIVVVVTISAEKKTVISGPDIISRGFVYVREADALMEEMKAIAVKSIKDAVENKLPDWSVIKFSIKNDLSNFLYHKTKRNPMILPVIMEV